MSAPMSTDTPKGPPSRPSTRCNNDRVLLPATMVGGGQRGNADGLQTLSAAYPPRSALRLASSWPLGSAPQHKVPRASTQQLGAVVPHRLLQIHLGMETMCGHTSTTPPAWTQKVPFDRRLLPCANSLGRIRRRVEMTAPFPVGDCSCQFPL